MKTRNEAKGYNGHSSESQTNGSELQISEKDFKILTDILDQLEKIKNFIQKEMTSVYGELFFVQQRKRELPDYQDKVVKATIQAKQRQNEIFRLTKPELNFQIENQKLKNKFDEFCQQNKIDLYHLISNMETSLLSGDFRVGDWLSTVSEAMLKVKLFISKGKVVRSTDNKL